MENKLDKLFRDKLEQHSVQPSANAWEKVAAGFPKKNSTITWAWRIAAALVLMGSISILVIYSRKGEEGSTLAKKSAKENHEQTPTETKKTEVIEDKNPELKPKAVQPKQTIAPKVVNQNVEQLVAEKKQEPVQIQNETIALATETNSQTIDLPTVTEIKTEVVQEKTLVIVYSLAPVESKPAVEQPVKTKPLQRVLTFAKDVKGGETTTLASVRDWKDSFFGTEETARIEKQKSNN